MRAKKMRARGERWAAARQTLESVVHTTAPYAVPVLAGAGPAGVLPRGPPGIRSVATDVGSECSLLLECAEKAKQSCVCHTHLCIEYIVYSVKRPYTVITVMME